MAREGVEIAAQCLHVHRLVGDRLCAVDQHDRAARVGLLDSRATGFTVPSAFDTWVMATSRVRGPSSASKASSSSSPASLIGAT